MAVPSPTPDSLIRLRNLCRSYEEGGRKHLVLDELNADFIKGETVALRGRSGSGKSTLLNLISGIDAPDSGEVEVAGHNIMTMSEHDRTLFRREHIGFVYQAFNLVSTLSISDNVRLVLELNGIGDPEAGKRIDDMLQAVELADRADSFPDVLSGGEQQRVALLLADEPTGNLDDETAAAVVRLLEKLVRHTGNTMIVATHSARVASFCDRVFELRNGKLFPSSG
jgi:putative ABC transport system ATP-binding protein